MELPTTNVVMLHAPGHDRADRNVGDPRDLLIDLTAPALYNVVSKVRDSAAASGLPAPGISREITACAICSERSSIP